MSRPYPYHSQTASRTPSELSFASEGHSGSDVTCGGIYFAQLGASESTASGADDLQLVRLFRMRWSSTLVNSTFLAGINGSAGAPGSSGIAAGVERGAGELKATWTGRCPLAKLALPDVERVTSLRIVPDWNGPMPNTERFVII